MRLPAKRQRVTIIGMLGAAIAIVDAPTPSCALESMTIGYYGSDATLATFIAKDEGFSENMVVDV